MRFDNALSIAEIVAILGHDVQVIGNQNNKVTGINEVHSVEPGNLSFVDSPKYYSRVVNSAAGTILINKEFDCPEGKTLIITDDPYMDYVKIVKNVTAFQPQSEAINPTAAIGEGTVVQPCSFVGENVVIGKNCIIHSNVSIYANCIIGDNVIIHSGSVIGADAYYFQKRANGWNKLETCGRVIIENDVEIGCCVTIDKGVSGDTFIGAGTKFDNQIQVGHDTYIGRRCLIGTHSSIAGCTHVDDDCLLWAGTSVNKDLWVAKGTTLLALSAVDKSVKEENTVLFGVPAYDARKKWKEIACTRMLPEMMEEFRALKNEVEELKRNK
ncbi:MAG: UDP-3-O-(3-hydroxymyristoyl)glucosamine N-acyltransferase [Bacteroidales bacterium]|nr:UDP-3-O-(3-hydroxymyristoyl)glucosamine N-acyltransferase [Bacteroidales bacterium]